MRLLSFVKGFTTNSSGSYQWASPDSAKSGQSSTTLSPEGASPVGGGKSLKDMPVGTTITVLPIQVNNANGLANTQFSQVKNQGMGNVVMLALSVIVGLAALALIVKRALKGSIDSHPKPSKKNET